MESTKQQQTVEVGRGLFLVRYADAEDKARPPKIKISSAPGSNSNIGFHLDPDQQVPVLWEPGSCLVVEAMAPSRLAVEVYSVQDGGSAAATVRIERLTQGKAPTAVAQTQGRSGLPADVNSLRILGHLAGIGDVWVNANEWLGGPTAPSRLEGISIEWPGKPPDLEINYAVKAAKAQPNSNRTIGLGTFAGTRGQSMPLVGLMLEMTGAAAENFQLSVDAIFLGSPAKRVTGKRVVASGPTGREPLVGLRLSLDGLPVARSQTKSSARKSGRSTDSVRVFRSRAKANQPETV